MSAEQALTVQNPFGLDETSNFAMLFGATARIQRKVSEFLQNILESWNFRTPKIEAFLLLLPALVLYAGSRFIIVHCDAG